MHIFDTKTPLLLLLLGLLVPILGSSPEALAQSQGDRIVAYSQDQLLAGPLPRGPLVPTGPIEEFPLALAYGPDDQLYAIRHRQTIPQIVEPRIARVGNDGQLIDLGDVPLFGGEDPVDFTFGPDGKIHVLTLGIGVIFPHDSYQRVISLDPETLEIVDSQILELDPSDFSSLFAGIAPAPDGFWLVSADQVARLDPETDRLDPIEVASLNLGAPLDADSDSTGALWILAEPGFIDPPVFFLYRFDPVTGALLEADFHPDFVAGPMAIQRRCSDTPTTRCLQGGRFLATVIWTDFAQVSGHGQVVPNSSADSTLFWFFDPANWELLVKVLDGCDDNGHFWVFAGATTDVGFELIVEDLETGDAFVFNNPLGNPPQTVNATSAFPGCP